MTNPNLKFKYVIIKHPTDFAIHEAYTDLDGNVVGVDAEPVTMYGYSPRELVDIANAVAKDIAKMDCIDHDCEELYSNYDKIGMGAFDYCPPQDKRKRAEIIEFRK